MIKIVLWLCMVLMVTFSLGIEPVTAARPLKPEEVSPAVLVCFSGGKEILRTNVVEGPFADEYKFAHEVKTIDEKGEHWLNFSGGICVIDQGEVTVKKTLKLTDELSCYSGENEIVSFDVYGEETTIDEYVEGRTFLAKARGNSINSDSLHRYLIFGGSTCIGEEAQ